MALSEHEERVLREIERQLAEDDPRFVARARRATGRPKTSIRLRWAVLGFVLGLGLLLGVTFNLVFGIVGFGLMLGSVAVAVPAVRSAEPSALVARLRKDREEQ